MAVISWCFIHYLSMSAQIVKTRTAEFFIDEHRILWTRILPEVLIDEFDAVDNLLVVRNLTDGKPCLKILDGRAQGWRVTEKAKQNARESYKVELTIGRAILVNSMLTTEIKNLFFALFNRNYPVRYFNRPEEAVNWLLSIKHE